MGKVYDFMTKRVTNITTEVKSEDDIYIVRKDVLYNAHLYFALVNPNLAVAADLLRKINEHPLVPFAVVSEDLAIRLFGYEPEELFRYFEELKTEVSNDGDEA